MSFPNTAIEQDLQTNAKPFLKWAGGKTQLIPELSKRLPNNYNRYFEPFIGGGAFFFSRCPKNSYISDINKDLIDCYGIVREKPSELIEELSTFSHDKDFFYAIRNVDRLQEFQNWSAIKKAARLIYLNRSCFNGLYRVNSKGYFNVPFGDYKNPKIVNAENIYACASALSAAEIFCGSFLEVGQKALPGDFIYFDPPYAPLNKTSSFTAYAQSVFGEAQQMELRDLCRRLSSKGVFWMLSNSSTEFIEKIYAEFNISKVVARRNINSVAAGRGLIPELIIRNYSI